MTFEDLFEGLGTPGLAYRESAATLDGRRVAIPGFVVEVHGRDDRFLLVGTPGACPDCSAVPVPAVTLPELRTLPSDLAGSLVVVDGCLGVGFAVDEAGEASFLRLRDVRILLTPSR
jgi:hypothetical protein